MDEIIPAGGYLAASKIVYTSGTMSLTERVCVLPCRIEKYSILGTDCCSYCGVCELLGKLQLREKISLVARYIQQ